MCAMMSLDVKQRIIVMKLGRKKVYEDWTWVSYFIYLFYCKDHCYKVEQIIFNNYSQLTVKIIKYI